MGRILNYTRVTTLDNGDVFIVDGNGTGVRTIALSDLLEEINSKVSPESAEAVGENDKVVMHTETGLKEVDPSLIGLSEDDVRDFIEDTDVADTVSNDDYILILTANGLKRLSAAYGSSLETTINNAYAAGVERSRYIASNDSGIMIAKMDDGNTYTPTNVPDGVLNVYIDNLGIHERNGTTILRSVRFGASEYITVHEDSTSGTTDYDLKAALDALGWTEYVMSGDLVEAHIGDNIEIVSEQITTGNT